ncbi:hypothetical protein ABIA39_008567 [Nocardia sp. GAS34]
MGERPATSLICEFIAEHRARFGVVPICRALSAHGCQIAPRTFYAWCKRPPSKRALWDLAVTEVLAGYYEPDERRRRAPESLYGAAKMWAPGHARQVQKRGEPGGPLDESPDRRTAATDDQVAFPVPGDRAVPGLDGPMLDQVARVDELLATSTGAGPRDAQRPPGAQARGRITMQTTTIGDIERLVDRLVRDTHRLVVGEFDRQPVGDLLRAP